MPMLTVGKENSADIELYYEDHGSGPAVVLIHGWPLSGHSWEKQLPDLLKAGYRVITYDRRGFGWSSQPATGYDYNTLANDLHQLITKLSLKDAALVGFSMGGGEVARYVGTHGTAGIRQTAFIAAITPALRKAGDNAEGVDPKIFAGIQTELTKDRPAFLATFFKNFYNVHTIGKNDISSEALQMSWYTAITASAIGTHTCVSSWGEDFRSDLKKLDRPTLVVHGDADKIVPFEASGKRMPEFVKDCRLEVIEGAPHGLNWTHADKLNPLLLEFLGNKVPALRRG